MKMLHINSYYSTSEFYKNLYNEQINKNIDLDVYVPVNTKLTSEFDYGKYTNISKCYNKIDRLFFHVKHHKIYKDINKKYNINDYSMIHAHSLFSNGYIAMKLKEKYNIPYVVAVRNTDVNLFFKRMIHLRKIGVKILRNADRIIFLSEAYKNQVLNTYLLENIREEICSKISIIPNGIDDFWFENISNARKSKLDKKIRFIQVGDINKNKNILTTVKALKLLESEGYTVSLDLVGKIKDKKIYNEIKNINFVNYLGYKNKIELIKLYRKNDIFILPSINETFGLVYAEAMSQGLPVIYSKEQGFDRQFEEGEVGYNVDCFNEVEIKEKINDIILNYTEVSSMCIKNASKFKWEILNKKYKKLYEELSINQNYFGDEK